MATELTIPQMVFRRAAEQRDKVALQVWRDGQYRRLTYAELGERVGALAGGLRESGVQAGDRVGILGENRPEWAVAYFAAQVCGGIAVPLDALLKPQEIEPIVADAGAKVVIVSAKFEAPLRNMPCVERVISMEAWEDVIGSATPMKGQAGPEDVAAIIYTSGTTGRPKGVMLTHRNILSDARGAQRVIELQPEDVFLSVLPLHHTFESTGGLICPIDVGATITYARSMKSRDLLEDIRNTDVTVMLGVPLLYEKLYAGILRGVKQRPLPLRAAFLGLMWTVKGLRAGLGVTAGPRVFAGLRRKAGLETMRLFICGGAPLPYSIPQGFEDLGFRFVQGYGLTETSPVLSVNPVERPRHNSVGVPVPGAQVRIEDPGPDGVGEIVVRGDIVMKGYYNNPERTSEVIRDGWFHTGDLGWADREGYLHISGRLKNLIVTRGGKNVYPEEIEAALNASPAILESLVYGIPEEDGGGEQVSAILVPDPEHFERLGQENGRPWPWEQTESTIRALVRGLNAQLSDYKRIRNIQVRKEEFPKTSTRKIQRFAIPELQKHEGSSVKR